MPDQSPSQLPLHPNAQLGEGPPRWVATVLVPLIVFLAVAPILPWMQFTSGSENLVAGSVLEMRRGGPWMVPTLNGEPRLAKPPLTAWIAASVVSDVTVTAMGSPSASERDAARRRFALQLRWPALLAGCLAIALTTELGRMIGGARVGLIAAMVAGTTMMFFHLTRSMTTDVQLMLWVAASNALLLKAAFERRWFVGFVGAGLTLGLAFMSKGPVALAQTVVPMLVWWPLAWWTDGAAAQQPAGEPTPRGRIVAAALLGVVAFAAIGLPWYGYVLATTPNIMQAWYVEVVREGATNLEPDPWYGYANFLGSMAPWTVFFAVGLFAAVRDGLRGERRILAAALLVIVPIVLMSFAKDKPARYLLPIVPAAAVCAAWVMRGQFSAIPNAGDRALRRIHLAVMIALVLAPLAPALAVPDTDMPWYGWKTAAVGCAALLVILLLAVRLQSRWRWAMVVGTFAMMLVLNVVFLSGYRYSQQGTPETRQLAEAVWATHPDAEMYWLRYPGKSFPNDAAIYANRTIRHVSSLDEVPASPAGGRPQLVVTYDRSGAPTATAPAGWTVVHSYESQPNRRWTLITRQR